MKFILGLILSVAILFSCNNSTPDRTSYSNLTSVELSIEGMSCEKMCGGAISNGLEKLDGVASTEVKFDSENPVDMVTVTFDPNKVSTEEMTAKVEGLAGGAYKVREVK